MGLRTNTGVCAIAAAARTSTRTPPLPLGPSAGLVTLICRNLRWLLVFACRAPGSGDCMTPLYSGTSLAAFSGAVRCWNLDLPFALLPDMGETSRRSALEGLASGPRVCVSRPGSAPSSAAQGTEAEAQELSLAGRLRRRQIAARGFRGEGNRLHLTAYSSQLQDLNCLWPCSGQLAQCFLGLQTGWARASQHAKPC